MIRSNRILRKALAIGLALCLAVSLAPAVWADAEADEALGEPVRGGGEITLAVTGDDEMKQALGEATVDVDVYLVAAMDSLGVYTAAPGFESLAEQIAAIDLTTSRTELTRVVRALVAEKDENGEAVIAPQRTLEDLAVVGGTIGFDGLGLYLIVPHAAAVGTHTYNFNQVLLSIPALGTDEDAANGRAPAEEGEEIPTEHLEWQYEYTVFLKPEQDGRFGRLEVVKELATYHDRLHGEVEGPIVFVFEVTATDDEGTVVFSDVVGITFDGPGQRSTLVEGIPVGSHVVVREIYNAGYTLIVDGSTDVVTIVPVEEEGENGPPSVTFVNDWDDGINQVVFVVNQFTQSGMGYVVDQQFGRTDG